MQTGGFTHDFPIFAVGARIARPRRVSGAPSPIVQAKASPNARRALGEVAWRSHDGGVVVGAGSLGVGALAPRPSGRAMRAPTVISLPGMFGESAQAARVSGRPGGPPDGGEWGYAARFRPAPS